MGSRPMAFRGSTHGILVVVGSDRDTVREGHDPHGCLPRQEGLGRTPRRHDLENTGKETLRAVAFFAAAMFTQDFDQVMLPPKSHILGTPNRAG